MQPPAVGDDPSPSLRVSGFGTAAFTHSQIRDADLPGAFADLKRGVGRSGATQWDTDSRLILQANWRVDPQVELVGQTLIRRNAGGSMAPRVAMAAVRVDLSDQTWLRLGRVPHPFFIASDTRLIGYANLAVRGPAEVHLQSAIIASDLLQVTHGTPLWGGKLTMMLGAGRAGYDLEVAGDDERGVDAGRYDAVRVFEANWLSGDWQLRFGHTTGISGLDATGPRALFRRASSLNAALTQELGLTDKRVSFTGLGLLYDDGSWTCQIEATWTRWALGARSIVPNATAGSMMLGRRIGALTPFVQFSDRRSAMPRRVTEFSDPTVNLGLSALAEATAREQQTASLGLRADLFPRAALKLQWDRTRVTSPYGASYLVYADPARPTVRGRTASMVSAAMDFVF